MRSRHREITTLSLSMLDVIAGAMAAFLILMVILLPYYDKEAVDQQAEIDAQRQAVATAQAEAERLAQEAQGQIDTLRSTLTAMQTRVQQAERAAQQQQDRADGLARQLARTFLVLYVRWDTHDDVDLHLTDPSGAEFYWNRHKTIPGRPGELSEDNVIGPGNEVWEIRDAPAGDYRVDVRLYTIRDQRKPVVVKGRVFHRDGSELFPEVQLSSQGQRERIATIRVDDNGGVGLVR
jgi:multidrug efflux pump subunit AcrA (membrane-fusion protein)